MRKFFGVFAILLFFCLAVAVSAETYTVSPEGLSLTDALAAAVAGDVIELADGVYAEPAEVFPLTVTAPVTITAAEGAHPVIDAPAFKAAFRVEAENVAIRGLDIGFRRTGFYVIGDGLTVERCNIYLADTEWRTSSCGAWFGGVRGAAFRDCAFTDCGICMAGPPLSERSRSLPVLTGLFEVGEELEFFTTHTIENCTVNGKPLYYAHDLPSVTAPTDAGEIIIAGCGEVLVRGADVSRASMGMEIVYCGHVLAEDCKADLCGVFGIYFAKLDSGEMVGCTSEGTNHGLDIRACDRITLLRCRANACDQGLFFSHVDNGIMQDCTVTATGQGYFLAGGNHCQLLNCTAEDCENGFNIQKENDVLVTDCTLRRCTICAARLDGSPVIFSGNLLEDNWVGIMAYGTVPFDLADNTVTGSGSCGLYLRDIACSRICGNVIADSTGSSVEAVGEMSGTLFAANALDKPVTCSKGAVLRMVENTIP